MLNNPSDLHQTKYSKFVVRPSPIKYIKHHPKSLKNMFSIEKTQILQDINDIKKEQAILNDYQVCGDKQFKATFIKTKKEKSLINLPIHGFKSQNDSINNGQQANIHFNNSSMTFFNKQPSQYMKQTIYMNSNHHENFLSTLSKAQKNLMAREHKTLEKFKQTQRQWQKIDSYLKLKQPKTQTVTYSSVKKVYVHENPQKLQLINDIIPKYWQYSLRGNDKTLKSYAKGNKYRKQMAQEMLQTLKGARKLQQSIPRIDSQRVEKELGREKIRLKGHSIEKDEGFETMRSFHKKMYERLNRTMRERMEGQGQDVNSVDKAKNKVMSHKLNELASRLTKKQQPSFISSKYQSSRNKKQINSANHSIEQEQSLHQQQGQSMLNKETNTHIVREYEFCNRLQELDRVDNEVYIKKYDRRGRWMYEGMEIGEL